MSLTERVQHLQIPLEDIKLATNNFDNENFIANGGFGKVYLGKLNLYGKTTTVAVKRLDRTFGQGDREFFTEIQMLSFYKHKNIVSLIGFCEEGGESILVYEYAKRGSLDTYLSDSSLSWTQRLHISLGAARGINYLHNDVASHLRVLHRDIKSSNILLNENWDAQISDFGLSKIAPSNTDQFTYVVTNACGTMGYIDPQYLNSGILTKESDVYSFGIVLFEILCGRLSLIQKYDDERRFLASVAKRYCEENRLYEIIHPDLRNEIKQDSLNLFSRVAYECLSENRDERPTMRDIVRKLEKALELQTYRNVEGLIRVGTWGRQNGDPENGWSFQLEKYHHVNKITIDHGDLIYSLIFSTQFLGLTHTSEKLGGWNGGDTISEVKFDWDEEINAITGTVALLSEDDPDCIVLSSISFVTNKKTHGLFGHAKGTPFSLPWEEGRFAGLYGLAGYCIDSVGVYLEAS